MRRRSLTGRAAVLISTAGLAAGLLGTAPAGAVTGRPVITLDTPAPVALPAAPATADVSFDFQTKARNLQAYDATLTVDARGLAKIAKVTFSDNCTAKGLIATCSEMFGSDSSPTTHMGAETRLTLTPLKAPRSVPRARTRSPGTPRTHRSWVVPAASRWEAPPSASTNSPPTPA